jgi:hypothetical protein
MAYEITVWFEWCFTNTKAVLGAAGTFYWINQRTNETETCAVHAIIFFSSKMAKSCICLLPAIELSFSDVLKDVMSALTIAGITASTLARG